MSLATTLRTVWSSTGFRPQAVANAGHHLSIFEAQTSLDVLAIHEHDDIPQAHLAGGHHQHQSAAIGSSSYFSSPTSLISSPKINGLSYTPYTSKYYIYFI